MNYTTYTLGDLLSLPDETIRRNAMSILKQLQRGAPEAEIEICDECGQGVHCAAHETEIDLQG